LLLLLLFYCCFIVVLLLFYCCFIVVLLLFYCCFIVVIVMLFAAVVVLFFLGHGNRWIIFLPCVHTKSVWVENNP